MIEGNKYKKLLSNSILFMIGSIGSKFITFFLVPFYTNILSTSEFGITDIVTTSVILCIPIFSLSLDDGIMRYGLMKNTNKPDLAVSMLIILFGSLIAVIVAYPIFSIIEIFGEWNIFFCIILILHIFRNAFSIYLKSVDRVKIFAIDSIFYAFVLGVCNIVLLKIIPLGIKGFFLAMIFAMLLSLVFQFLAGNILRDLFVGKVNKKLITSMIKYSFPLIFSAISWWVINSSNRFMLKYMLGYDAVGLYAVSAKIPNFIGVFTSVFSSAWLISSINEYENEKDKNFYSKTFEFYQTFLVIFASSIILVLKPFMTVYVGADFFISWQFVPFLLIASVCGTLISFFTPIFKAELKNIKEMKMVLIGAIMNIVFNLMFIPKFGIQGASIGTMVTSMLMLGICITGTRALFCFDINFITFIVSILVLVIQSIVTINCEVFSYFASLASLLFLLWIHRKNVHIIALLILRNFKGIQ